MLHRKSGETIGQYAKRVLIDLSGSDKLTQKDIDDLLSISFCTTTLARRSKFPVLLKEDGDVNFGTGQKRYYANDRLIFGGKSYHITSQWYEVEEILFNRWAKDILDRVDVETEETPVEEASDVNPDDIQISTPKKPKDVFEDTWLAFAKKVADYACYRFTEPAEIMKYYDETDDWVFEGKFYMLKSIALGRHAWAHPIDYTIDRDDLMTIGMCYMNILTKRIDKEQKRRA